MPEHVPCIRCRQPVYSMVPAPILCTRCVPVVAAETRDIVEARRLSRRLSKAPQRAGSTPSPTPDPDGRDG